MCDLHFELSKIGQKNGRRYRGR